jgi:hypothetical protein
VRRPEDLQTAFAAAVKQHAEALIVGLDGITQANLRPIADLAVKHRLPSNIRGNSYRLKDKLKAGLVRPAEAE